ncbi:MAG: MmcQ/YjbR family DNA-binding protein [Oscillospiraceae bacterium]|nr:MmcQ/YjbR family DNA-binding protein [Oscillospiraceae bacterium]
MEEKRYREAVLRYAEDIYGTMPEYLWKRTPNYAVLRNRVNRKWYGAVMDLPRKTLGLTGEGIVDILDVKCSPVMIGSLLEQEGYLPAYHMNKNSWITVLLDGTVPMEQIISLLDLSYQLTEPKLKKAKGLGEW